MLQKIKITGLFDQFDYEIELKPEGITILTGPNGYGKTTILKAIYAFTQRNILFLLDLPFSEMVLLHGEEEISVAKESDDALTIRYGNEEPIRINRRIITKGKKEFLPIAKDFVLKLQETDTDKSKDSTQDEKSFIGDLFKFLEEIKDLPSGKTDGFLREWEKRSFGAYFIREQRLLKRNPEGIPGEFLSDFSELTGEIKEVLEHSIEEYAKELSSRHIKDALAEASKLNQELDGSFPERLFQESGSIDEQEFNRRYDAVRQRQNALSQYGLSTTREGQQASFKEENARALRVYLDDTEKKLAVFDGLLERLEAFSSILDKKQFANKEIEISPEFGFRFRTGDGKELPLTALSSGEQQEVVLLYELLFKVEPGALVLIDEPETSLHVAWQREFLDDLSRIVKLRGIQVLLATHSPDIIGKYWDWVVDLWEISQ